MEDVYTELLIQMEGLTQQLGQLIVRCIPGFGWDNIFQCGHLKFSILIRSVHNCFRFQWIKLCIEAGGVDVVKTHIAASGIRILDAVIQIRNLTIPGGLHSFDLAKLLRG